MYSKNPFECVYIPETELTIRADNIMAPAHDATGMRYGRNLFKVHPRQTAAGIKEDGYGEVAQAILLLHDVIEDTDEDRESTLQKLLAGVDQMPTPEAGLLTEQALVVIKFVDILSKRPGEARPAYLDRVKAEPIAATLKSRGDARAHIDYNEWKLEQKIRRAGARSRIKKYRHTQELLEPSQLTPQEFDEAVAIEMARLAIG